MKIVLISILATLISMPAYAFFDSGNDLVEKMKEYEKAANSDSSADYMKATEFRGYVVGVHDALTSNLSICTTNVTKRQISAIVKNFMNANPARWSEPAYHLVEEAIKTAFPCKK